jgi:hypothetical protein
VVFVGLTLTGVPLVTEMLPGAITAVPPLNTAVRLELEPASMVDWPALKLVIVGTGSTVTVDICVAVSPPELVTVSVYAVVVVGLTLTAVPLVTERFPGVITPVPPLKTAVRLELEPASMVDWLALKLVILGGVPPPPPPPEFPPPQPARLNNDTLAHKSAPTQTIERFTALLIKLMA